MLPALLLCVPGDVWIVDAAGGPGAHFPDLSPAVAAAGDGDTLLVRSGAYGPLHVAGKSLVVVAEDGALVRVEGGASVADLAEGQTVLLRGLHVEAPGAAATAFTAASPSGVVWVEECTFDGGPAVRAVAGTDLVVERCKLYGAEGAAPTPALVADGARVTLHSSSLRGGAGADADPADEPALDAVPGAPGAVVTGGELYAAGAVVEGGAGGDGAGGTFPCQLVPADGGPGLHLAGGEPVVRLLGTQVKGGAPGDEPAACPAGVPGPDVVGEGGVVEELPGVPVGLALDGLTREGQVLTGWLTAAPGTEAFVAVASEPTNFLLASFAGPSLVGGAIEFVPLGEVGPSGAVPLATVVGEMGAGLFFTTLYAQGAACSGGGCTAGAGATTVLLDLSLP